jgi:hypothetical protein
MRFRSRDSIPDTDGFPAAPRWDADTRTLYYGGRVVKRLKHLAPNQEPILAAFEEEGWRRRIDDPIPGRPGADRHQRLRDALRALNEKQDYPVLRFEGDGTGTGIIWRWVKPPRRRTRRSTDGPQISS